MSTWWSAAGRLVRATLLPGSVARLLSRTVSDRLVRAFLRCVCLCCPPRLDFLSGLGEIAFHRLDRDAFERAEVGWGQRGVLEIVQQGGAVAALLIFQGLLSSVFALGLAGFALRLSLRFSLRVSLRICSPIGLRVALRAWLSFALRCCWRLALRT